MKQFSEFGEIIEIILNDKKSPEKFKLNTNLCVYASLYHTTPYCLCHSPKQHLMNGAICGVGKADEKKMSKQFG